MRPRGGNAFHNGALNMGSYVSREVILRAIGEGLERSQQAAITVLNQVQDVNVIVRVSFRD